MWLFGFGLGVGPNCVIWVVFRKLVPSHWHTLCFSARPGAAPGAVLYPPFKSERGACAPNVIISAYKQAVSAHFAGRAGKRGLFQIIPLGPKVGGRRTKSGRLTNGGSSPFSIFHLVDAIGANPTRTLQTSWPTLHQPWCPDSSESLSQ